MRLRPSIISSRRSSPTRSRLHTEGVRGEDGAGCLELSIAPAWGGLEGSRDRTGHVLRIGPQAVAVIDAFREPADPGVVGEAVLQRGRKWRDRRAVRRLIGELQR